MIVLRTFGDIIAVKVAAVSRTVAILLCANVTTADYFCVS
jgi:hypothetical protein